MKKILIVLFVLLGTVLLAEEHDIAVDMQNLDHMVIPTRFEHASIHVGASIMASENIFPMVNVSIPFGGDYLILGGIGAGNDPLNDNELTLFSLGLGYKGQFAQSDLFKYLLSVNVKTFQSPAYQNTSLTGEFDIEQEIDENVYFGLGLLAGIQHYITNVSSVYGFVDDRTFSTLLKVSLKTPYVNFQAKGSLNMFSLGTSFTLNLDN